jgi:hypothetical protein
LGNPCVQARGRALPSGRLSPRIFRDHFAASFDTLRSARTGGRLAGRPPFAGQSPRKSQIRQKTPRQGDGARLRALFS